MRPPGRRTTQALVGLVAVAVAVALLWAPVRGYLETRAEVADQRAELARLEQQNDRLQRQKDRLEEPAEIQRIARRDYGLVGVGEESYTILPPATAGLALPRSWPFNRLDEAIATASAGR